MSTREETLQKINTTALDLFSKEGYYNASIRNIASEAGIALGLLYSYHKNKEALLQSIFQEGLEGIKSNFLKESKGKSIEDQMYAAYNSLMLYSKHWRLFHSVRMQASLADFLHNEIEDIQLFFLEHFRKEIKKTGAKGAKSTARVIWCFIDGLFAQSGLSADYPDEKAINVMAGMLKI